MLRAGAIEIDITPPIGVELAGYGPRLGRFSEDIHDPLMAQILALDDGYRQILLASLDSIGISESFVRAVRAGIEAQTGIPAANVMLAATHSHTAPTVLEFREWGTPDPEYVRFLSRQIIGAAGAAVRRLAPVELTVGHTQHTALAWNRTGRSEVDPTVGVLRLDRKSGEPLVLIVHYACHPVMLGPRVEISADYPGAARRFLKQQYSGAVVMFLNGACGDIDPITNKTSWGQASFADVEKAGVALGASVSGVSWTSTNPPEASIRVAHQRVSLGLDAPSRDAVSDEIHALRAKLRESGARDEAFGAPSETVEMPSFWLSYCEALAERQRLNALPSFETVELQAFFLRGDVAIMGIPAEVYTAEGMAIRARSPYALTLPVCYANGLIGYVPPPEAYRQESYTAVLAAAVYDRIPFQADVSIKLVDAAVDLLDGN